MGVGFGVEMKDDQGSSIEVQDEGSLMLFNVSSTTSAYASEVSVSPGKSLKSPKVCDRG